MWSSIIFIIFICVKSISTQANLCLARDVKNSNCVYFKICNNTGDLPVVSNAPCLEGSGDGAISIQNTPPFIVVSLDLTKLQPTPEEGSGFCKCDACSEPCGNYFTNTRCNKSSSQKQDDTLLMPIAVSDTKSTCTDNSLFPVASGKGGVCVSNANATVCLGIVFCNVVLENLGISIPLADLLPFCLDASQVNSNFKLGPGIFSINIPNFSNQTSSGDCTCTGCSGPCSDNPLVGCPKPNKHCSSTRCN